MTPEEYLQSLGLDLSVSYDDFDADQMERVLKSALQKVQDKKDALENFEHVKSIVFVLLKILASAAV